MFRDQRLGGIPEDVLEFLSSKEADRRIYEADLLVDRAHLIMLKEQGLVSADAYYRIINALDELEEHDLRFSLFTRWGLGIGAAIGVLVFMALFIWPALLMSSTPWKPAGKPEIHCHTNLAL